MSILLFMVASYIGLVIEDVLSGIINTASTIAANHNHSVELAKIRAHRVRPREYDII